MLNLKMMGDLTPPGPMARTYSTYLPAFRCLNVFNEPHTAYLGDGFLAPFAGREANQRAAEPRRHARRFQRCT
jgi:hypothetical protein